MKIAIASGDAAVVDFLRRVVASVPQNDVIWTAASGTDAARRCATQPPEVLLMGLSRSGSEAVEATQRIMRASPCGIIIVTTSVERDVPPVFAAMGAGALDVIALPAKERDGEALAAQILQKVRMAGMLSPTTPAAPTLNGVHAGSLALIAIGASAGGPPAIAEVLRDLPPDLPAAFIVVQHVDAQFGAAMAHWFSSQTKLSVRLAAHGDRLKPGVVYLAAGEQHVVLNPDRTLAFTDEPRNAPYRPSADVLFESIARNWQDTAIGVVLSGMGRDGAVGLLRMRKSGARTIAQDQSTSAVFGMPRAAAELSAATDVLPLPAIGPLIKQLARATPVHRDPRPVAVTTRALPSARPGARKEPATAGVTIVLLVDDQPIVAAAVRQLIAGEADLEFHYCGDPSEAIARANILAPTVILQDLVMPGIDGLELLRLFRDNPSTAETPIVMLSANDDARAKSASFDAGASDYLVKLPEQVELVARIRYHSSACLSQRRRAETAAALLETQQALAERVEELQTALNERSRYRDELEAANQRLERESFLDALTGALNRRGFEHQLVIELRRAKRDKAPLFALLIDCDNFKGVNDDFGHDTGDQVLKGVASRVAGAARISDPLARVGGDEFLILLPEVKGQAATALAERVRNAVASVPIETDSGPRSQTVSVGVFEVPEDAVSTTDVLARGTGALHESKQAGRNRVSVASSLA